jgi:hypothetical protein
LFAICVSLLLPSAGKVHFSTLKSIAMSFVLTFFPPGFTAAKYDETVKKLEAAGAGSPKGRTYHICYGDPAGVHVTDIWDSMENFQAFGNSLLPIMGALGVDPGQPEIYELHNTIKG